MFYCCWVTQSVVKPFWGKKRKRKLRAHVLLKMHFSWQESRVCVLPAKHPCFCSFPFNLQHIGSRQVKASCFYNKLLAAGSVSRGFFSLACFLAGAGCGLSWMTEFCYKDSKYREEKIWKSALLVKLPQIGCCGLACFVSCPCLSFCGITTMLLMRQTMPAHTGFC